VTRAKISEYSATAGDNTDVNGTNIAEGCPPSGINDAIREVMAALKRFETGADGDSVTVGGNLVVSGSTTANTFSATQITASGPVITSAGSASAPAIVPTGDTNTGIFFPAADTIAFAEGGAEAMRITSDGRVGINVTSPSMPLDILSDASSETVKFRGSASNIATLRFSSNDGSTNYSTIQSRSTYFDVGTGSSIPLSFTTAGTERMRIDSSGNVEGSSDNTAFAWDAGNGRLGIIKKSGVLPVIASANNQPIIFSQTNQSAITANISSATLTERARITSGGVFLVGKTTTGQGSTGFEVNSASSGYVQSVMAGNTNGTTTWDTYSTGAGAYRFYVGLAGTVFATNTTISAISDQRHKENIRDLDVGLDAIMQLRPRKFDWKTGKGKDIQNDRGFVAQEFEQVFPDLIDEWRDPAPEGEEPYKSVRQDLIPVLVKAIQELKAINDAQAQRIETLEAKVSALEAK